MMTGDDGKAIWCQAKTWRQAKAGGWGESNIGCLKHAVGVSFDGHFACRVHLEKASNGWNV